MKAIVFHEFGGVEKLNLEDFPEPKAGTGEVLVRIKACALNHLDIWERQGLPGVNLPHISGSDIAGVVEEYGSSEEAASMPLVFLTAWHMLVNRDEVKPPDIVLVQAGGSGVGIAAIQIAKLFGAFVITTVGSDEKVQKAKDIGADKVINYKRQDFEEEVKKITGKQGVDIVIEHIGPDVWEKSLRILATNGRLVTRGATSGPNVSIDLRYVFSRHISIHGLYMGRKNELLEVLRFIESGKLKPVVHKVFELRDTAHAQPEMLDRRNFGKIVLKV